MPKEITPATTLKQRNRWLSFAEEQEGFARQYERDQEKTGRAWPVSIARHRASAARYRAAAAAYRPVIEGEQ